MGKKLLKSSSNYSFQICGGPDGWSPKWSAMRSFIVFNVNACRTSQKHSGLCPGSQGDNS